MTREAEPTRVGSALRYLNRNDDTSSEDDMADEKTMKVRRAQSAGDKLTDATGTTPDATKLDKLEADGDGAPSLAAPAPSVLGATSAPAATTPEIAVRRYKVWERGTFQRDGITFQPGDELTLPENVAKALECLIPA